MGRLIVWPVALDQLQVIINFIDQNTTSGQLMDVADSTMGCGV